MKRITDTDRMNWLTTILRTDTAPIQKIFLDWYLILNGNETVHRSMRAAIDAAIRSKTKDKVKKCRTK